MSANKEATSSSSSRDAHAEKSVDKLNVREFRERFCIPNGEQFNAGLRFPLPSLVKEFLHFTQIPPAYIHPNMVFAILVQSGSLTAGGYLHLFNQEGENDIFSFGLWAGLAVHPDRPFAPNQSLKVLNFLRLRRPRGVVKRFSPQNLRSVTQEPQSYADARSRKARLNKREKKRQEGLCGRLLVINAPRPLHLLALQQKRRRRNNNKRARHPRLALRFKRLRTSRGSKPFGPSMPVVDVALSTEEATSVNQPGSPHPDADAVGASCAEALPPTAPPTEETGRKSGLPLCKPNPLSLSGEGPLQGGRVRVT
ncbi:hypothetical protein AAG906_005068 [Vitis piasezkii]